MKLLRLVPFALALTFTIAAFAETPRKATTLSDTDGKKTAPPPSASGKKTAPPPTSSAKDGNPKNPSGK